MDYVAPPIFTANQRLRARDMRTLAGDIDHLARQPIARAHLANVPITFTGAFEPLTLDTVDFDPHGGFVGGPWRVPFSGLYRASARTSVTATAANQRLVLVLSGSFGQVSRGSDRLSRAAGNNLCGRVSAEADLVEGSWIRPEYYMDVGLTFEVGSALTYFSVDLVAPA